MASGLPSQNASSGWIDASAELTQRITVVHKLQTKHPRAAALTVLSSLIALSACGGGQGDVTSLDAAATEAEVLETAAARRNVSIVANLGNIAKSSTTTTTTAPVPTTSTSTSTVTKTTTTSGTTTSATATKPTTAATTPATTSSTTTTPVATATTVGSAALAALASSPSIGSGSIKIAGPSSACGVNDIGGWTVPVPAKADATVPLTHIKQPGSRLFYISAANGSDSTGQIYFWNGSAIIDASGSTTNSGGQAYGTDPMNPSAAVKTFKRWSQVAPRRDGGDIGSTDFRFNSTPATRAGYPDWWMFARGETFDLSADIMSFVKQSEPTATTAVASLAVAGGRSASEPQVVGAYGSPCLPRPHFVNPVYNFITRYESPGSPIFKNAVYLSLHFDAHGRSPAGIYDGVMMFKQPATSKNILFEDIWFDAAGVNISSDNNAQVTLRRSLVTDVYYPGMGNIQGVFYGGAPEGVFRIEESILLRNGFNTDPKTMAWPPAGANIWNIFNRNLYLSGETKSMESGVFDTVSMLGTSGDQFRPGMRTERNFFYQGYLLMGAQGGKPDSAGPTGNFIDNVLQRFTGTGTNSNIGHPNWGLGVQAGASHTEITRNIFTGAQWPATAPAVIFKPHSDCPYTYATRGNKVTKNIFDSGTSTTAAMQTEDGMSYNTPCATPWSFRGVTGNSVTDNILINSYMRESAYVPKAGAIGTSADTMFSGNRTYSDRASAAAALGWTGPNRTLKTYLQANGFAVSSADGFPEYFAAATQMQRGKWKNEITSKPIVNHFKTGFGMTPLP